MRQTTKNILGVAAIVLLSSGVGGYTAYKLLSKERMATATFNELFPQNPAVFCLRVRNLPKRRRIKLFPWVWRTCRKAVVFSSS